MNCDDLDHYDHAELVEPLRDERAQRRSRDRPGADPYIELAAAQAATRVLENEVRELVDW